MDQHRNALRPGYKLHWYHIEAILGQGGFGITYLAQDTNLNQPVAIKEYLPVELAVREDAVSVHPVSGEHGKQFRWGLDRFISEAQTLARFRHPHIIRVLTVFRENNTAYMVMEYEQGRPLHEILKDRKTLPEEELKNIILPILDGLEEVHAKNFIHRDIKPANIYLRADQTPVLLDFGSARRSFAEQTRTLTTMISPGYAPFEQYVSKSRKQGPWTDIYGLGATLYRAATGIAPPDSMDRSEALLHTGRDIFVPAREIAAGRYSAGFLAAIDHAMAFKPEERPQTIAAWRREIAAGDVAEIGATTPDEPATMPVVSTGRDDGRAPPLQEAMKNVDTRVHIAGNEKPQAIITGREGPVDRIHGVVGKLLKWSLLLLIILIAALVLVPHRQQEPALESALDTAAPPPAVQQSVPQAPAAEAPPAGDEAPLTQSEGMDQSRIQRLLDAARDDLSANRLTSPAGNNAVEKYREVLELEPGNREAIEGLDAVVSRYLSLMDNALGAANIPRARNYLARAEAVNPDHPGLPAARSRLEAAIAVQSRPAPETDTSTVATPPATEPEAAQTELPETRIPEAERAELQSLKERLRDNPRDQSARRALKALSKRFEENIRTAVDAGNYTLAKDYIREVQSVTSPDTRAWRKLEEILRTVEDKEARAGR